MYLLRPRADSSQLPEADYCVCKLIVAVHCVMAVDGGDGVCDERRSQRSCRSAAVSTRLRRHASLVQTQSP